MIPLLERVYRGLLLLMPRGFRERYEDEMLVGFSRLLARAEAGGRLAVVLAGLGGLADLVRGMAREWVRREPGRPRARAVPASGGMAMGGWIRDARYALRSMRRRPMFTLVAAGSLAVGIGATTAVLSVANTLLAEPLPGVVGYDRIVELGRTRDGSGFDSFAHPDFVDIRREVSALDAAAAWAVEQMSLSTDGEGTRVTGFLVSHEYFGLLGVEPAHGRLFGPDESEGLDANPVAVVSHGLWERRFGADPDVVGSTIDLNRHAYQVVGVLPEAFQGHLFGFGADVYVPFTQAPSLAGRRPEVFEARGSSWHMAVGRLGEGVTLAQLNRQLAAIGARLAEAYPESNARRGFRAVALGPVPGAGRAGVRLFLTALLGMVVLILLITCTNVAGMLLARSSARHREMGVRIAMGAGRRTLVQQLTMETLSVFALGGLGGVGLGLWAVSLLRPELLPIPVPFRFAVEPDMAVIALAAGVTLATGLVFGVWPALRATRVDVASSMKEGAGASEGRRVGRLRTVLAGGQVALSLVLLVSAGLFLRSLQRAANIDAGFDPDGVHLTFIDLSLEGYDDADGPPFFARLLGSLRAEAWVEDAALATDLPLDLSASHTAVVPEGWDASDESPMLAVDYNRVSDGYFETLSIPQLAGRTFRTSDDAAAPRVAVVSETFARTAWEDGGALGRTFRFGRPGDDGPAFTVVGVVADVKNQFITERPKAFVYVPLAQQHVADVHVLARSGAPPAVAARGLEEALVSLDPDLSRGPTLSLAGYTALGTLPQRVAAALTSGLGLLALLLSGLGIYGVISFIVGAQRREIGIRMALGQHPRAVRRSFLARGLKLALPGLVVGGALSLAAGRVLGALLLDLSPYDPAAIGTVGVLLLGVVIVAAWIPAARAARVDPVGSLRSE